MKVVAENSDDDLKRRWADRRVGRAVRALTANLMRVTRGAGKPYEIGSQAHELTEALIGFTDAWGYLPGPDRYDEYLNIAPNAEIMSRISEEEVARAYAKAEIVRASLQLAASELLRQRTQASIARGDFYTAIREPEAAGEMRKKRMAAEAKAAKAATKPVRRKGKVKPSNIATRAD